MKKIFFVLLMLLSGTSIFSMQDEQTISLQPASLLSSLPDESAEYLKILREKVMSTMKETDRPVPRFHNTISADLSPEALFLSYCFASERLGGSGEEVDESIRALRESLLVSNRKHRKLKRLILIDAMLNRYEKILTCCKEILRDHFNSPLALIEYNQWSIFVHRGWLGRTEALKSLQILSQKANSTDESGIARFDARASFNAKDILYLCPLNKSADSELEGFKRWSIERILLEIP